MYISVASLPSPSSNIEAWPYGTSLRFASLLHLGHKGYVNIFDGTFGRYYCLRNGQKILSPKRLVTKVPCPCFFLYWIIEIRVKLSGKNSETKGETDYRFKLGLKKILTTLGILPLTMYLQINDIFLLSKIIQGGYDVNQLKVPDLSYSVRGEIVFQISRSKKAVVQQSFVYRTTRLVNLLKIDINCDKQTLKVKLLKIWHKVKSFDEQNPCSWRVACDWVGGNRSKERDRKSELECKSGVTCHMAMPQCCYLAKGAKRPSHTTNMIKFDCIPFDPCNSIKRFDLCPFDQKNSTF